MWGESYPWQGTPFVAYVCSKDFQISVLLFTTRKHVFSGDLSWEKDLEKTASSRADEIAKVIRKSYGARMFIFSRGSLQQLGISPTC